MCANSSTTLAPICACARLPVKYAWGLCIQVGQAGSLWFQSSFACRWSERTVRGAILGSGTQPVRGGVPGGLGVAAGNSLSKISPVWRKAEGMVVRLNVCSRMVLSATKNYSLLKSKQPVTNCFRMEMIVRLETNQIKWLYEMRRMRVERCGDNRRNQGTPLCSANRNRRVE